MEEERLTTTAVKERPILFSAQMVRAILDGRKTQTRRVVSLKHVLTPEQNQIGFEQCPDPSLFRCDYPVRGVPRIHVPVRHPEEKHIPWPDCGCETLYYPAEPGDRLWVREAFSAWFHGLHWYDVSAMRLQSRLTNLFFRATHHMPDDDQKWVPSIFMPRWASRITLEITGVRVERVQDISEEDAEAEGVESSPESVWWMYVTREGRTYETSQDVPQAPGDPLGDWVFRQQRTMPAVSAVENYRALWQAINGKRPGCSWADNPWVWCVEFKRLDATM